MRVGVRWKAELPSDYREGTINQGHEIDHRRSQGHAYDALQTIWLCQEQDNSCFLGDIKFKT
jgi:hypothetical protein